MKTPSRNISQSLAGQGSKGRGEEEISVSGLATSGPSMIVPGDGKVDPAPGAVHERSASKYTGPQSRHGGG